MTQDLKDELEPLVKQDHKETLDLLAQPVQQEQQDLLVLLVPLVALETLELLDLKETPEEPDLREILDLLVHKDLKETPVCINCHLFNI